MHIFLRVALTSAASRPSALQIGLLHIHRISAVTSAVPYMESVFSAGIGQHGEHPEPPADPVLELRLLSAAAASGIPCDQPTLRRLNRIESLILTLNNRAYFMHGRQNVGNVYR